MKNAISCRMANVLVIGKIFAEKESRFLKLMGMTALQREYFQHVFKLLIY